MFQTIYAFDQIMPQFLKIVMGLGRKTSSKDEDFMTSYSYFSTSSKGKRLGKCKSNKGTWEDIPASGWCTVPIYINREG
jgi:hypothetical protein